MIYNQKAIIILDEALKTYLAELDYISHLCKDPMIGDESISKRIAETREIKKEIHAKRMEVLNDIR